MAMIEDTLEEEIIAEFKGATLSIHSESKLSESLDTPDKQNDKDTTKINGNHDRSWNANIVSPLTSIPNKISASLWGANKTIKENSLQQSVQIGTDPADFFTFRESVLAKAISECEEQFLDEETDGPLIDAFLLTQISHWNSDKERLILLTKESLVVCKYDFIALKRLAYQKIALDVIDEIIFGNLSYPTGSLIPDRNMKGLRLTWCKNKQENYGSGWNPFNDNVPFCTFTFHPLYFHKDAVDEKMKCLYNLELFKDRIAQAVADLPKNASLGNEPCVSESDIILQSYIGIGSVIHNRHALGFFKVRGKFSF